MIKVCNYIPCNKKYLQHFQYLQSTYKVSSVMNDNLSFNLLLPQFVNQNWILSLASGGREQYMFSGKRLNKCP